MVRIYVSDVIDAPIGRVWPIIRDFNGLPNYHPLFTKSEIESGKPADAVGCVRSFYAANGGHLREELLSLSDREHSCVYRILESPLPVTGYVAGFQLRPITEGDRTFVDWWAEWEMDGTGDEAETVDLVANKTFRQAFQSLKAKLGA
jgi:Polyketide cyclase / dehydrase and lipid transport